MYHSAEMINSRPVLEGLYEQNLLLNVINMASSTAPPSLPASHYTSLFGIKQRLSALAAEQAQSALRS